MKKKVVKRLLASIAAGTVICSMSMGVFASGVPSEDRPAKASKNLDGQGYIAAEDEGDEGGPDEKGMVDITIPAHGFLWYANEDTKNGNKYDIKSAEYAITNNSETIDVEVTLEAYRQAGGSSLSEIEDSSDIDMADVVVGLAGDLYVATSAVNTSTQGDPNNLVNNTITTIGYTYEDTLKAAGAGKNVWNYSFYGTYNQNQLPDDPHTSDYILVLGFEAVYSNGQ